MIWRAVTASLVAISVSGCGLTTPDMRPLDEDGLSTAQYINSLTSFLKCEMAFAVYELYYNLDEDSVATKTDTVDPNAKWLSDWAADITLTLRVNERSTVEPTIRFPKVLEAGLQNGAAIPKSKGIGFGVKAESNATRDLTLQYFLDFRDLLEFADKRKISLKKAGKKGRGCRHENLVPINGSFKVKAALESAVQFAGQDYALASRYAQFGGPIKVLKHNLTFKTEVVTSVTPSITLKDVVAGVGKDLLSGSRVDTNDLIVSMGPVAVDATSAQGRKPFALSTPRPPSMAVENSNFASQIGNAVDRTRIAP